MNKIVFILFMAFAPSFLFAQEGFHLGTVKGENVTYEVKRTRMHHVWSVVNVHNPDTTYRPHKVKIMTLSWDVHCQIAEILNKYLTKKELQKLEETDDYMMLYIRIGSDRRKLQQVTKFMFCRSQAYAKDTLSYNGLWLNLSPDRLHELEKRIVEELIVPEMFDVYGTDDIFQLVTGSEIADPKKAREAYEDDCRREREINESIRKRWNEKQVTSDL